MSMLSHALRYAAIGWPVFPLKPRDKVPVGGRGVLDASTDRDTITAWWTRTPDANIGLACGEKSGVIAMDIDPRHGGDHVLEQLIDEHGALPSGALESHTGGGGIHYFFEFSGEKNYDIARGVEIKSTGKYVVLPPSVHPSGNPYVWEISSSPFDDDENDNDEKNTSVASGNTQPNTLPIDSIFGKLSAPPTPA